MEHEWNLDGARTKVFRDQNTTNDEATLEILDQMQIKIEDDELEFLPITPTHEVAQTATIYETQTQSTLQPSVDTTMVERLKRKRALQAKNAKAYRERKKAKAQGDVSAIILEKKRKAKNAKAYRDRKEKVYAPNTWKGQREHFIKNLVRNARLKAEATRQEQEAEAAKYENIVPVTYNNFFLHHAAHSQFKEQFLDNNFGIACSVCDRLWYEQNLKCVPSDGRSILSTEFPNVDLDDMLVCITCYTSLKKGRIPLFSTTNGFKYPPRPYYLPQLNLVTERLISPRLPFMQIRRLRHAQDHYDILGQIINVPVLVNNMATCLPRVIDDDYCINVHIKSKKIHKSSYLMGLVNKQVLREWLEFLIDTPLYKLYAIRIDSSLLKESTVPSQPIENVSEEIDMSESLQAQQQTLLWNADNFLKLSPSGHDVPISLLIDAHCEELAFPSIYLGQFRVFKEGLIVTPYMIASSEIRRSDRRGVTPQHLLYMAMKILRIRTRDALTTAFKYIGKNNNLTLAQLESSDFVDGCLETDLAFLRSIPNSIYRWAQRKRDLFAMIRQFGKPTFALTMSTNEMGWPKLMKLLCELRNNGVKIESEEFENMSINQKATLINEDPITCAIHFNKLVQVILDILQSPRFSPFGDHYVKHYFKRIEFEHSGSPHAHILLWLNKSPIKVLMEEKVVAETLIDELVSVSPVNASEFEKLQEHKHTLTCCKNKNSTLCHFEAPFMPCSSTQILQPMSITDPRRQPYIEIYKRIWKDLETNDYPDLDHFLRDNKISSYDMYIDILRASITRPRVFLKRETTEKWINPFNPFILNVLGASMDFQFIVEECSCAEYILEYVNKSNGAISNLKRKIIDTMQEHPECEFKEIATKLSVDLLNSVELTSQEAAWFLLRQDVSKSSKTIVYIPTVWPAERECIVKSDKVVKEENIEPHSYIWLENCFGKYQKRPEELDDITLSQAVSYYSVSKANRWTRRRNPRLIRYRNYDVTVEPNEFKREMVTLHLPFRDEENDILAGNKYIEIYDANDALIMERRLEFESNLDFEKTMKICRCIENNENEDFATDINFLAASEKDADANMETNEDLRLDNIMDKADFKRVTRSANNRQKNIDVKTGLRNVLKRIDEVYAQRPKEIKAPKPLLVAVSKTKPVELIIEAYNEGQRHFGENYIQELVEKSQHPDILKNCPEIKWHFIGNFQKNKINKIIKVPNLYMIESLDDENHAIALNKSWEKRELPQKQPLRVLIQINTSGEEAKGGITTQEAPTLYKYIHDNLKSLQLEGIMTIGAYGFDYSTGPNPDFLALMNVKRAICETNALEPDSVQVSMGMSNDFDRAIELGSTIVRVGTSIFGQRAKKND